MNRSRRSATIAAGATLSCRGMGDGLDGIRTALAAISDTELTALQAAADECPQLVPGLFADLVYDRRRARRGTAGRALVRASRRAPQYGAR